MSGGQALEAEPQVGDAFLICQRTPDGQFIMATSGFGCITARVGSICLVAMQNGSRGWLHVDVARELMKNLEAFVAPTPEA